MLRQSVLALSVFFIILGCDNLSYQFPASQFVEVKTAESVTADIRLDSGNLYIIGAAQPFFLAQYRYHQPTSKPNLDYKEQDKKGYLLLTQQRVPSIGTFPKEAGSFNDWILQFNDQILMEINVEFNRGQADLQLGTLNLKRLNIIMGEGNINVDIHQQKSPDLFIKINGAQGNLNLKLPKEAAVKILTDRGEKLENIVNFKSIDDGFVNTKYQDQKEHWLIDLKKADGEIVIEQSE